MLSSMKFVEPVRRTLTSRFKFRCHKDISCFNQCCKGLKVLLTPYDIIRIKRKMGISSGEFLGEYTDLRIDEKTSFPYVVLKLSEGGLCPFLREDGCDIYEDRPTTCRYYPVGQGIMIKASKDGPVNDEFFFFIKDPACLGHKEDREWTIDEWRVDQGADIYDEMNREWRHIQLKRDTTGHISLDSKRQSLVYMISYDMDRFRRYVFESKFLDVVDIDTEEVEAVKTDDVALMKLGFKYLKYILMIEETLKVKERYRMKGRDKHLSKASL